MLTWNVGHRPHVMGASHPAAHSCQLKARDCKLFGEVIRISPFARC